MKTPIKKCPRCNKNKQLKDFSTNGWCRVCAKEYLRIYKSKRLDFKETLLSDDNMKKEMKSVARINPKGLNALSFLTDQYEQALKIKSYGECKKKNFNPESKKILKYPNLIYRLTN